jgi:hypothetical protein
VFKEISMFRRLMHAFQYATAARTSSSIRLRHRPSLEQLECRLAPSVTPLSGHLDLVAIQPAPVVPIHVASVLPASTAPAQQDQVLLAVLQATQEKTAQNVGGVISVTAPTSDPSPARLIVIEPASPDAPLETNIMAVAADAPETPPLDLSWETSGFERTSAVAPVAEVQAAEPEIAAQRMEAESQITDRAEFFASTVVADEAQYLAPESSALAEDAAPANSAVLPSAQGNLPLLVWVLGMACLLMLRWDRRAAVSSGRTGWARCRKMLAELAITFNHVWRPRARSACV